MITKDHELTTVTEPKNITSDLPKDFDNNNNNNNNNNKAIKKIDFIKKHDFLAEHAIANKINQLLKTINLSFKTCSTIL